MATRKTTTPSKTVTAKPRKAAPKAAAKGAKKPVAAPKATIVETVKPVVAAAPLKKPELVDRVMAETGMKKKDVKPVVEAMLAVMGKALADGEELTVPPLGKVMVKRVKDVSNAKIINLKLRHPNKQDAPVAPLAKPAE